VERPNPGIVGFVTNTPYFLPEFLSLYVEAELNSDEEDNIIRYPYSSDPVKGYFLFVEQYSL